MDEIILGTISVTIKAKFVTNDKAMLHGYNKILVERETLRVS